MGRFVDLSGRRVGRLTVLRIFGRDRHNHIFWLCRCDCGKEKAIQSSCLTQRTTKSCGCLNDEAIHRTGKDANGSTHGLTGTRLYRIWKAMKGRCGNPNKSDFYLYGARGVSVCDEWKEFERFRDWALSAGYRDDLTLDRIDVDGNYCPANCRWLSNEQQQLNKRNTVNLTIDGVTKPLTQWAREAGLRRRTVYSRMQRGISGKDLISPLKRKKKEGGQP